MGKMPEEEAIDSIEEAYDVQGLGGVEDEGSRGVRHAEEQGSGHQDRLHQRQGL